MSKKRCHFGGIVTALSPSAVTWANEWKKIAKDAIEAAWQFRESFVFMTAKYLRSFDACSGYGFLGFFHFFYLHDRAQLPQSTSDSRPMSIRFSSEFQHYRTHFVNGLVISISVNYDQVNNGSQPCDCIDISWQKTSSKRTRNSHYTRTVCRSTLSPLLLRSTIAR